MAGKKFLQYLHLYNTESDFNADYNGDGEKYHEPWTSYIKDATKRVNYNKRKKYEYVPLTFDILSSGTIRWKSDNTGCIRTIEYSKNGGAWTEITSATGDSAPTINVEAGDVVQFKGDNATYSTGNTRGYVTFSGSTAQFNFKGNILSLIDSTDFGTMKDLESAYTFCFLFRDCTGLTDINNFVLPATGLTTGCYESMFYGCNGLKRIETNVLLPATILADECYSQMFMYCNSLLYANVELPAPVLTQYCYNSMFAFCYNLGSVSNSMLKATTLAPDCYAFMFQYCRNLETGPDLPAPILMPRCYEDMFAYCNKLNYIKCLATDRNASNCIHDWVYGVQTDSGKFVKDASTTWSIGNSGIPNNWIVDDA